MRRAANAHDWYHGCLCLDSLDAPATKAELASYMREMLDADGFANVSASIITLLGLVARTRFGSERILSAAYVQELLALQEDDEVADDCRAALAGFVEASA
jgi:hypothetical protein